MKKEALTKYWFITYVLSALVILGGLLLLSVRYGPSLETWLMAKLVPSTWQPLYLDFTDRLFRDELRGFLVTSGFGVGIVVIGLTLFPLKEKLSATYEEEYFPELEKQKQAPLWQQGLEELKLAGFYLLLQGVSLYLAAQGFKAISTGLSVFYLILAMSLDHSAPFFQRRGRQIHGIIWILLRRAPLWTLVIGALFICPILILEKVLPSSLSPTVSISLLVIAEVLGMACATIAGCHLGATLLSKEPELTKSPPPPGWSWSYRVAVVTLVIWMSIFFTWWGKGALFHARFVKCRFKPTWSEVQFKIRDATVHLTLPVKVTNRSEGSIDPTELEIIIEGGVAGDISLTGPKIEGGEEKTLTLTLSVEVPAEELLRGDFTRFMQNNYTAHIKMEPPLSKPVLIPLF